MRKTFLFALLALLPLAAQAETLAMPPDAAPAAVGAIPGKGMSMADVTRTFGEPRQKHAPAGGDAPQHPPIHRWDYEGFSVFFERGTVIDAVVEGAPAPVQANGELQPAPPAP